MKKFILSVLILSAFLFVPKLNAYEIEQEEVLLYGINFELQLSIYSPFSNDYVGLGEYFQTNTSYDSHIITVDALSNTGIFYWNESNVLNKRSITDVSFITVIDFDGDAYLSFWNDSGGSTIKLFDIMTDDYTFWFDIDVEASNNVWSNGFTSGKDLGLKEGLEQGLEQGFDTGYLEGLNAQDVQLGDMLRSLIVGLNAILGIKFGNISLGAILLIPFALMFVPKWLGIFKKGGVE